MGMSFLWESHGKRSMGWDRHKLLWDGTDKYVPWTTLHIGKCIVLKTCWSLPQIPTFQTLLWKNMYLFLERCGKSNNLWLRALMQSASWYSSLFFEHYNRILLCDWVLGHYSVSGRVHATILPYFTWPWPGLDSVSCSWCSVVPSGTG